MLAPGIDFIIPSRERATWLLKQRRHTLQQTHTLKPTFIVRNDDSQMEAYKRLCAMYPGANLDVYDAQGILGAAQTMDYAIDRAIAAGMTTLVYLDDDLSFAVHNSPGAKPLFRIATPGELQDQLLDFAWLATPQMPLASMTPIMKRSQPNIIGYAQPIMMAYAFYLPFFRDNPQFRFWQGFHIEARCDLNLTLSLLTHGYLTGYLATCFIPDNVNNPGGCSTYRDLECEKKSVAYLKATYPGVVRTHLKRGWVGDPNCSREAPVIGWKKAFNHAAFEKQFNMRAIDFTTAQIAALRERIAKRALNGGV